MATELNQKDIEYWSNRSIDRVERAEKKALSSSVKALNIYTTAEKYIDRRIQKLFNSYKKNGSIGKDILNAKPTTLERVSFSKIAKEQLSKLGISYSDIYDEKYISAFNRLTMLKQEISLITLGTTKESIDISTKTNTAILTSEYEKSQSDMESFGIQPTFSTLDKSVVDPILLSKWYGGNYSTRIWKNTEKLARDLPNLVGASLLSGQSYVKTAKIVKDRYNVRRYEALRLIRTESNYFANQAELQSYVDDGVSTYEYLAILDKRTSDICENLDGNEFKVSEAQPGKNYPPMHGNCRSTTVVKSFGDAVKDLGKRVERFNDNYIESVTDQSPTLDNFYNKWGKVEINDPKPFIIKIQQGGDKALNAEAEYIMTAFKIMTDKRKVGAMQRLDEIITLMKDEGQRSQIVFLKKYMDT